MGRTPFGIFPKIHLIWLSRPSLRKIDIVNINENRFVQGFKPLQRLGSRTDQRLPFEGDLLKNWQPHAHWGEGVHQNDQLGLGGLFIFWWSIDESISFITLSINHHRCHSIWPAKQTAQTTTNQTTGWTRWRRLMFVVQLFPSWVLLAARMTGWISCANVEGSYYFHLQYSSWHL